MLIEIKVRYINNAYLASCASVKQTASSPVSARTAAEALTLKLGLDPSQLAVNGTDLFDPKGRVNYVIDLAGAEQ